MRAGCSDLDDPAVWSDLADVDPDLDLLLALREQAQARRLILLPAAGIVFPAVRQALFHCRSGEHPSLQPTPGELGKLADYRAEVARWRRTGRSGVPDAAEREIVEYLARLRCARRFATPEIPAECIFVSLWAVSRAHALRALCERFLQPGDAIMALSPLQGGHPIGDATWRRTRQHMLVPFEVSADTGRLDYEAIVHLARERRPRMLIAAFASHPWAPDWARLREVSEAVGDCMLVADISQAAGLVVAGEYPTPLGHADAIVFATNTGLCGPPGAVVMTTDADRADTIDLLEEGGGDINRLAAMAAAFGIAGTDAFRRLQGRVIANARTLSQAVAERGIVLAYGGTDTHFCVADLRGVASEDDPHLLGETAARILGHCGIVAGVTAVPGDRSPADAHGIALGTQWITQGGLTAPHVERLADAVAQALRAIRPFTYVGVDARLPRGKIDLAAFERARAATDEVACRLAGQVEAASGTSADHGLLARLAQCGAGELHAQPHWGPLFECGQTCVLCVSGDRARAFLQGVVTGDLSSLDRADSIHTFMLDERGRLLDDVVVVSVARHAYLIATHASNHVRVRTWLQGLSDGHILFDEEDLTRTLEGPVVIEELLDGTAWGPEPVRQEQIERRRAAGLPTFAEGEELPSGLDLWRSGHSDKIALAKGYFVGQRAIESAVDVPPKPRAFEWREPDLEVRRTPLHAEHRKLTRKMAPFAGWDMPVWYTSIAEEHAAVREAAGLFDIGHMGVIEITGQYAVSFLDTVTTNHVADLQVGQTQYAFILDPDGLPMDDILLYRRGPGRFMMVVNAANAGKIWAWLNAVNSRETVIDREFPHRDIEGAVTLSNLREPEARDDQRMGMALQGPASAEVLRRLRGESPTSGRLAGLPRFHFVEDEIAGIPALISRTGYTGERIAFELFVHPDHAGDLWRRILEAGEGLNVKPAGLGARDSTRIEAGLPLYGHEIAGPHEIIPTGTGYGWAVKRHKPFFIGRERFVARERDRSMEIVRFQLDETGSPAVRAGDLVASHRGEYSGTVTSCTLVCGQQLGLAYVDRRLTTPGTAIDILPLRGRRGGDASPDARKLCLGDRLLLSEKATVLPRFWRPGA